MSDTTEPDRTSGDALGPSGHLTPEQLDDLATQASADIDPDQAGVGSRPDDALHAHLAGCADCRTALGDQIAVQGWLRRMPSVGPMPGDVAARLDAALADARRDEPAGGSVLPLQASGRRAGLLLRIAESRATKSLVAAAAVVAIGVGGYAAIQHTNSSAGDSAASSAKAASGGAAEVPNAAGGGNFDAAAAGVRASGTAYTKQNITAEVTKQLALTGPPAAAAEGSTLTTPAGLHACLAALGYPSVVPQLVDLATYDGKPVAVIVLPGDSTGRQIWVVSRTCTTGNDGTAFYGVLP